MASKEVLENKEALKDVSETEEDIDYDEFFDGLEATTD